MSQNISDRNPAVHSSPAPLHIRLAREDELDQVNILRKQVSELHAAGKPEIFKPGFPDELGDYVHTIWNDPQKEIVVAEMNGCLCGVAILNHIVRPETPFMFARDHLDIDEFCVDHRFRRQGIAGAIIRFVRDYALEKGIRRIELNMWEFNRDALAFYEAAGFKTYRRYMEMDISTEDES